MGVALPKEQPESMRWYSRGDVGIITTSGKILLDPDLCREHWPVARKRNRCCECRRHIKRGERYQLIEGLWDGGSWDRFKTCTECAGMRNNAVRHYRDGIPFGDLHEHLAEEVSSALGSLPDGFDPRRAP